MASGPAGAGLARRITGQLEGRPRVPASRRRRVHQDVVIDTWLSYKRENEMTSFVSARTRGSSTCVTDI
jgi:hypothetical protein